MRCRAGIGTLFPQQVAQIIVLEMRGLAFRAGYRRCVSVDVIGRHCDRLPYLFCPGQPLEIVIGKKGPVSVAIHLRCKGAVRIVVMVFGDTTPGDGVDAAVLIEHLLDNQIFPGQVGGIVRFRNHISGAIELVGFPLFSGIAVALGSGSTGNPGLGLV